MKWFWNILIIIVVASLGYYIYNQTANKGDWTTQKYEISTFDKIDISTFADVNITQSDQESISIDGYEKNLKELDVKVEDNTLKIGSKNKIVVWLWFAQKKSIINISIKDLNYLKIAGSGDVFAPKLKITNLEYVLDGSGKANFADLSVNSFTTKINGSGSVNAIGSANQTQVDINGSGKVDMSKFVTENARVIIAGSGNVKIDAIKNLVASINGTGEILYIGEPFITENIMGSGKIEKLK